MTQRRREQVFGGAVAWLAGGHRGRRNAEHPDRTVHALGLAGQRMRFVRLARPLGRGLSLHEHAAVLDTNLVHGHAIRLVAGFTFSGPAVELPVVPRADHVVTVELALTQRSAHVVADAGDRAELPVLAGERDPRATQQHLLEWLATQLVHRPDVDPGF